MKKKSAYTLTEILVVIMIIGLMSVGVMSGVNTAHIKENESTVLSDFSSFAPKIVEYLENTEDTASNCVNIKNTVLYSGINDANIISYNETTYTNGAYSYTLPKFWVPALRTKMVGIMNLDYDPRMGTSYCYPICTGKYDPWNYEYKIYTFSAKQRTSLGGTVDNKDLVIVYSGGKNGKHDKVDDYMLVISKLNGKVSYGTVGFANNIGNVVVYGASDIFNKSGNCESGYEKIMATLETDSITETEKYVKKFHRLGVEN